MDFINNGETVRLENERIEGKLDYMYDFLDYDYDRAHVRNKYLKSMHKKTSLADIGEKLDELVYDSKAKNLNHYEFREDFKKHSKKATTDYTSNDFKWSGRVLKMTDPKAPLFIDDPSLLDQANPHLKAKFQKVVDTVKFNDEQRDHSVYALTEDEKNEISLFHSMKQDPYYKHYLYNHLRKYADDEDDINLTWPLTATEKHDIYDHAKFDKLNLFDFRRNLPMKEKEAQIDSKGRAYGFGKRKTSKAIAVVMPGKGRITVNGKPLLQSLFMPMQRQRILTPLSVTNYTCLLDVNLKVWGGGFNGQVEAIIPAISKAIQGFDMNTRRTLKYYKLMKHDPRNFERKKIGKQKARKGNVYRRR